MLKWRENEKKLGWFVQWQHRLSWLNPPVRFLCLWYITSAPPAWSCWETQSLMSLVSRSPAPSIKTHGRSSGAETVWGRRAAPRRKHLLLTEKVDKREACPFLQCCEYIIHTCLQTEAAPDFTETWDVIGFGKRTGAQWDEASLHQLNGIFVCNFYRIIFSLAFMPETNLSIWKEQNLDLLSYEQLTKVNCAFVSP